MIDPIFRRGHEFRSMVVALALLLGTGAALEAVPDGNTQIKEKRTNVAAGESECSLRYLESGPSVGFPVVLLHGGRFTADTWVKTKTIAALSARGFHVFAVDLPGFGKTRCTDAKADVFLRQMFASLGIEKAVVVSPSMSGRFSLPLLTTNPRLLAGFVAVAPVGIPRFAKKLKTVTVSTLAIWGEKDSVIPVAHADTLVKATPNARKVVLPGAKHPCYVDDPATRASSTESVGNRRQG